MSEESFDLDLDQPPMADPVAKPNIRKRQRAIRHWPIPLFTNKLFRVHQWVSEGDSDTDTGEGRIEETDSLDEADIVTSALKSHENWHTPVIDLDVPAALVPSQTPGHYHLYISYSMTTEDYFNLLDAMAKAGIVEPGYVAASKARGFTAARLPWIAK